MRSHTAVLAATDFFTTDVWTPRGLVTYYVLFFMHVATRRVHIAGLTPSPNERWMTQVARNTTMADTGFLVDYRYLIHDRDRKCCPAFDDTLEDGGVTPVRLPPRSPNLNAHAERWVKSVKDECLSKLILFGEPALRTALGAYVEHFHAERNPGQGQPPPLPAGGGPHDRPGTMPRSPRRTAEVLPLGSRMSFLTTREETGEV